MPPEILFPVQHRTLRNIKRIRCTYIKTTHFIVPDDCDAVAPVVAAPLGVATDVVLLLNKGMSRLEMGLSSFLSLME